MIPFLLKFFGIFFVCLFKFIAGPILGSAAGFSIFEIILVTVGGMMTSVTFITYLGEWFKSYWNVKVSAKKKLFSRKNRRIVKIWQKFGPIGIAALTPVLLTPIGGAIIMSAFNVERKKVLLSMFISALIWATFLSVSINSILSIPLFDHLLR